jgi:hypothetical protein
MILASLRTTMAMRTREIRVAGRGARGVTVA